MIFYLVAYPLDFASAVLFAPSMLFPIIDIVPHTPFWLFHNSGWESLIYSGSPFIDSLLELSDFFFESSLIFLATPTRASICASFGSLVDYLPEVKMFLYFFKAVAFTYYVVYYLF